MKTNSNTPLTPKQAAFVQHYLIDLNATQAAIRAGYRAKSAYAIGSENLRKPEIASAIAKAKQKRAERVDMSADRVLLEIKRLAFFDPRKLFNDDGSPRAITELDEDTVRAVAGLDVHEEFEGSGQERQRVGLVKKWKIVDKVAALTLAMRHLGMLDDRLTLTRPKVIIKDFTGKGDPDSPARLTAMTCPDHDQDSTGRTQFDQTRT